MTQQQRGVENEKTTSKLTVCSQLLLQVRLWEGNQEEEVSLWATGPSPSAADVRLLASHHGPSNQHRAPEKVRLWMLSVQLRLYTGSAATFRRSLIKRQPEAAQAPKLQAKIFSHSKAYPCFYGLYPIPVMPTESGQTLNVPSGVPG